MPTYDYRCTACEHEFELFQSMSDSVKKKCPQCSKLKLERLIGTGAAVLFKGDGFYETDYRSESYKKAAAADKKPEGSRDSKPEAKSDRKADSKPEAKSDSGASSKSEAKPAKDSGKTAKPAAKK